MRGQRYSIDTGCLPVIRDDSPQVIEERSQLKEALCCLQAERDSLFDGKLQLEADLHSCVSAHLQQRTEMERVNASYLQMESVARCLQQQNEVLCGKVHIPYTATLTVESISS